MAPKSLHLIISGRVQGVFFRAESQKKAQVLGLKGWVQNLPTGQVELYAQGDEKTLKQLLDWCKKGPPQASVEDIQATWDKDFPVGSQFEVKHR